MLTTARPSNAASVARLVRLSSTAAAGAAPRAPRAPRDDKPRVAKPQDSKPRYNNIPGGRVPPLGPQLNEARLIAARQTSMKIQADRAKKTPPHLMTLADLSPKEIEGLVLNALALKLTCKQVGVRSLRKSLQDQSVALMFSKRSTRTRVASESSVTALGGNAMFLGSQDIQLGVNESLRDTATVVGSMVDGIMARVNGHDEVETLAKYSPVPVVNALSDLYHPTQILADLLTLVEVEAGEIKVPQEVVEKPGPLGHNIRQWVNANFSVEKTVKGKKMAYVGDTNNMTNEFLVVMPRFGMTLGVASPKGFDKVDPRVWQRVTDAKVESLVQLTNSPAEALKDADVVVTDTWISMGQEEETAARLTAFAGYQLTNKLINESGAKADWKFMHCLPRHKEEVDDEVFYGDRSVVFPEAENRKWTIMAVFDALMGRWEKY